ncbi:hypothetical protein GE061_020260 [Apolygus lucorum]|uniref:Uncharacterized protein n=1 Tax=Apolygus lucorum TaxID=248454 RepID=A0A8S9WNF7_APOLU|nr:hypothetical protein GE061_020260 [Apolygus lucorum]
MMVLNEVFDSFSLVVMRPHNHLPRKDFPLIADLKKRIKDRVLYESTDIRFIFDEECRKSDPEIAAKLDYQSMSSSLRKARTKFLSSGAPLATSSQLQPLHQQYNFSIFELILLSSRILQQAKRDHEITHWAEASQFKCELRRKLDENYVHNVDLCLLRLRYHAVMHIVRRLLLEEKWYRHIFIRTE